MFDISNNGIITITRGDTAVTNLVINVGTELHPVIYPLDKPEIDSGAAVAKVYFAIMEPGQPFEHALVKKVFDWRDYDTDINALKIKFASEDTEFLLPGVYYYTVKLRRPSPDITDGSGLVDTLISKRKFIILD